MESWTIIIIGATGDLSRRRLIPTLYELLKHQQVSFDFIGAAKEEISAHTLISESIPHADKDLLATLLSRSHYQKIDFEKPESFIALTKAILAGEKLSGTKNRLVYCAIDSHWYHVVTEILCKEQILIRSNPHHRIVYEKPFGWDAESAQTLNSAVTSLLDEEQIYRVDHYMSKALVASLLTMRFSNVFFEPLWNNEYIDHVQIVLSEKDTLKKRGSFYDRYGALKDVVQNHLFQLLAYVTLEKPSVLDHESISTAKLTILKELTFTDGIRGQYRGYTTVPGVDQESTTETYAFLRAEINSPRWSGVPLYLVTGKGLDHKSTEIHIIFKPQNHAPSNRLVIKVSPHATLLLTMNAQKIEEPEIVPVSLEFCYRCTFGPQPHSYQTLFLDIMKGDKTIAVSFEEIEAAWNCIAQIEMLKLPLYHYEISSAGPQEAQALSTSYQLNKPRPGSKA